MDAMRGVSHCWKVSLNIKDFDPKIAVANIHTKRVRDLDWQSEMIIFKSILTTFEASIIFKAAGAVVEIDSSLKPNHRYEF